MLPPLSLKPATLDLPNVSDPINLEIISTPEPTLSEGQSCSSTQTSSVYTQPSSCTLKTRHSPTPPPTNFQVTLENYTVLSQFKLTPYEVFFHTHPRIP